MKAARIQNLLGVAVAICLLVGSQPALAQLPERFRGAPPPPSDPTLEPPLPATEPRVSIDPAVQPGILVQQPGGVVIAEREYMIAGGPPGQVQVTAIGPRSLTLTWQPVDSAMGYRLHLARQGESEYLGGAVITEATATAGSLLPGTTYSFKVSAVYPPEMRLRPGTSAPVSATTAPAAAPSGLKGSAVGQGRVSLSWDALPESDGFRLFRNGTLLVDLKRDTSSPISPFNPPPPTPLATSFADSVGVGTYQYQIQAVYRSGGEAVSALVPTPAVSVTIEASSRVKYCQ